ncbi:MAG: 1,4-alpha-glucan branching protein GlgB [Oscillospiraceae bacterium]|nr:1,4-alpha-glucan branching protein GlgB [Oscillospiraceae bacterium]
MDLYSFYMGQCFDAYQFFGAHYENGKTTFRTFAPEADHISLIGEFSSWQELPMKKVADGNVYELSVDGAVPGMMYKYKIYSKNGVDTDHCDPYGFGMELRPNSASYIRDLSEYTFHDSLWMRRRSDCKTRPLNIYEVHLGSWRKKDNDSETGWYTYDEIADQLIDYVKDCGYNYVEVMPLSEHPSDESWGYQNTGFFSPTSRYGTATQLKQFVDKLHQNNIGVIMDFVPVHFALDAYGLHMYDGTALYEYPHYHVGDSEWGSRNFMHSRGEVRSFLQSAANFWLEEFHFDGLRMDAIRNLIYWQGDEGRGENKNAIDFLRVMNQGLKHRHPTAILAAEDSTAYPNVTKPAHKGGLGFDYKWDLGWMHDTLEYFQTAPEYRSRDYHKLTFSMHYFYNERFLLPLSHDEVVHGKATIAQKMNGDYDLKFPQAKALYLYMYGHPGKKLNFMGNEIAQLREWDEKREQDWGILTYPNHDDFHRFIKKLNRIYLKYPALSVWDFDPRGFSWLDCHQEEKCIYAFLRTDGKQKIACVFNFSDKTQDYTLELPNSKQLTLLITNEWHTEETVSVKGGQAKLTLAPFAGRYYLVK